MAYGAPVRTVIWPATDPTLTMLPLGDCFNKGYARRHISKREVILVRTRSSYSPGAYSGVFLRIFVPTLFTRISNPPHSAPILSKTCWRAFGRLTSAARPWAGHPFDCQAETCRWTASDVRAT